MPGLVLKDVFISSDVILIPATAKISASGSTRKIIFVALPN